MRTLILLPIVLIFSSCVTPPKQPMAPKDVSLIELQEKIEARFPFDPLGLVEVEFEPCREGIKGIRGCQSEIFSMLGFRLRCRQTTGTVQSVGTLSQLPETDIRWEINGQTGYTELDEEGYGLIRLRSVNSIRNSKVKLFSGTQFLYMSVEDIREVVVPVDWCR